MVIEGRFQPAQDLHTRIVLAYIHPCAQLPPAKLQKLGLPARIEPPHALEVRCEISLANKVGERRLQQKRGKLPGHAQRPLEGGRKAWRRDKKADAQRRKQRLPEGPYIDYPLRMIEPAQRRYRLAAKSLLAIV